LYRHRALPPSPMVQCVESGFAAQECCTAHLQARVSGPQCSLEDVRIDVLSCLESVELSRIEQVDQSWLHASVQWRLEVLRRRGLGSAWTWPRVRALESALFCDLLRCLGSQESRSEEQTSCGGELDNKELPCSFQTYSKDREDCISSARCITREGLRPKWISFSLHNRASKYPGAHLTFSAGGQQSLGLADIVISFSCFGSHSQHHHRNTFRIQTDAIRNGRERHAPELVMQLPDSNLCDVAIHLDWEHAMLAVFICGLECFRNVPFTTSKPIRCFCACNWIYGSHMSFSDLLLGDICPQWSSDVNKFMEAHRRVGLWKDLLRIFLAALFSLAFALRNAFLYCVVCGPLFGRARHTAF